MESGFEDFINFLYAMTGRVDQVQKAVEESERDAGVDPVQGLEDRLQIKVSGRIAGPVPLMDEETAKKAASDPEMLNKIIQGEQLRDALGEFIVGEK